MWVSLHRMLLLQDLTYAQQQERNLRYLICLFFSGYIGGGACEIHATSSDVSHCPFYETFLFPPPLMAPFRAGAHQAASTWLTPAYTCLLLIVTDLSPLCPSTVLLEMSPLVYSCKIRSFILQVYKFHALSRRENG